MNVVSGSDEPVPFTTVEERMMAIEHDICRVFNLIFVDEPPHGERPSVYYRDLFANGAAATSDFNGIVMLCDNNTGIDAYSFRPRGIDADLALMARIVHYMAERRYAVDAVLYIENKWPFEGSMIDLRPRTEPPPDQQ